jgi:hypothetical protein
MREPDLQHDFETADEPDQLIYDYDQLAACDSSAAACSTFGAEFNPRPLPDPEKPQRAARSRFSNRTPTIGNLSADASTSTPKSRRPTQPTQTTLLANTEITLHHSFVCQSPFPFSSDSPLLPSSFFCSSPTIITPLIQAIPSPPYATNPTITFYRYVRSRFLHHNANASIAKRTAILPTKLDSSFSGPRIFFFLRLLRAARPPLHQIHIVVSNFIDDFFYSLTNTHFFNQHMLLRFFLAH